MSVVIPLYNKAPHVEAALRSVQAQSLRDLEIIVVDDGSSDGGAALVEAFDDPRIILIRQANAGAGAARNTGIQAATGQWVAFLDADDLWLPDKISRQLHVLDAHPDITWAGGAYVSIEAESAARSSPVIPRTQFVAEGVIDDALASSVAVGGGEIWTSTVMVRRDALRDLGGFDPTLRFGEDSDLWIRLAVRHPRLVYVQTPIALRWQMIRGSQTALMRAEGVAPVINIGRRWTELLGELSPERAGLLRTLARQLFEKRVRHHFVRGRSARDREALEAFDSLGLGTPSWPVRLRPASPVPG